MIVGVSNVPNIWHLAHLRELMIVLLTPPSSIIEIKDKVYYTRVVVIHVLLKKVTETT